MYSDHISYQAIRQPHAIAVALPTREISYERFEANINTMAHHLRPLLKPVSRVAVAIDKSYAHWLVVLALARLGHVSAFLPTREREARAAMVSPDAIVMQGGSWAPAGVETHILSDAWLDKALASPDPGRVPERPRPQDPARIVTSSGTTGTRKLMLFSHETIIKRLQTGFGFSHADSRDVVGMGMGTLGGFALPVHTWLFGGAACLIKPTPTNLLERRVTGLLISPAGLRALLHSWPADFPQIPNLTIMVGGSSLSKELSTAARLKLTPDIVMAYGSTEVSGVTLAPVSLLDRDPSATGIVLPWVDIEIVDDDDKPVPAGQEGRIRVRADAGVDGYLDDPETSARVFRDGWFYPGDIGSMSEGILRVAGRTDDVMNIGGVKVLPGALEAKLAHCRGVEDVVVFSTRGAAGIEAPWCAVVTGEDFDKEQFDAVARQSLRGPLKLLSLKEIPRNDMGKAERVRLREMARRALGRA